MIKHKSIFIFLTILLALTAFSACDLQSRSNPSFESPQPDRTPTENIAAKPSEQLPFGNPSNADLKNKDNYLLIKSASAISYNNSRGAANWIQWLTTKKMLGDSIPRPEFEPDMDLPKGFKQITTRDYIGSGYQRGHIVPSADRFGNREANRETFLMTNIVPQLGALNEYPWQKLESYVRSQVRNKGFDACQIAGVYGEKEILKSKVTAPTNCWKIIAFVRRGQPLESINKHTQIIAVDMPNVTGIENKPWETYKTTIRTIEERTGLNFFAWLSPKEQVQIETQIELRTNKI